ncbi:MAG TPA: hypothetical protein VF172_07900 [Nitrososphaera sp.]
MVHGWQCRNGKEAGDRFSGTINGKLDKNRDVLDRFKLFDVK